MHELKGILFVLLLVNFLRNVAYLLDIICL